MKLRSGMPLWSALQPDENLYPSLSMDETCEVLVIGAGITGALIAHRLTKDGISAILVDATEVGQKSTAASTGLLQYEIDTHLADLIGKVGQDHAVHTYRRGLTAIEQIAELVAMLPSSCDFARRESLYFASSWWQSRALRKEYDCRRQFGFNVDLLERAELLQISSISAHAAIRSRGDAQVNPLAFTRELVALAASIGLRVFTHSKLTQIDERPEGVLARGERGTIRAEKVVYATGYQSERYLASPKANLNSTYALASQPNLVIPGWPDDCLLWETARPYFYARRTADGRVIIGGEDTEFANDHDRDELVDQKVTQLVERTRAIFPEIDLRPEYTWAGTLAETKDGLAFIGQPADRPSAYFALGYGGNGITFSVIAADLICDLYAGRPNPDAEVFRFGR